MDGGRQIWWRFSSYARSGNHIVPAAGANVETFDPWESAAYNSPRKRGGKMQHRRYQNLLDYVEGSNPERNAWRVQHNLAFIKGPTLLEFCSNNGLLGLFSLETRQVIPWPRWEAIKGENAESIRPALHYYVNGAMGWQDNRVLSNRPKILDRSRGAPIEGTFAERDSWAPNWPDPGVLKQSLDDGIYYEKSLTDSLGDFFPSIPAHNLETFNYPLPNSQEFWQIYGEDIWKYNKVAYAFADAVRELAEAASEQNLLKQERRFVTDPAGVLHRLAFPVGPLLSDLPLRWRTSSLISAFAVMAIEDLNHGLVRVCGNCYRVYVSTSGRARYCSPQCRKALLQRRWRAGKDARGH